MNKIEALNEKALEAARTEFLREGRPMMEAVAEAIRAYITASNAEREPVNEDALRRMLAQAYDREHSAQRGEPDPWNLDDLGDIGDSDTWVSERLACARVAAEAFLSTLSRTGAVKVKVKPLEWRKGRAETPFGPYHVIEETNDDEPFWFVMFNGKAAARCGTHDDEASAIFAAQADYERRILSALEATPPAPMVTEDRPTHCGGCGETEPAKRCIGCLADFGPASLHQQETADADH